ncbi:hypothetical protein M514_25651 [Trichuris suis]|uniref:DDE-1 domain-containing protein n=1 Tax=Trichuris suis TaxID=68888 RepID=A0A085MY70_9BILA|nr:hypothetical protein M514_25651 [Trichuris suis]
MTSLKNAMSTYRPPVYNTGQCRLLPPNVTSLIQPMDQGGRVNVVYAAWVSVQGRVGEPFEWAGRYLGALA